MIASNLALAAREIRKNLFRSLLTVLGVVIGVAAVVAIVTIGDGAAARITSNFDRIGATTIIVTPGAERRGPPRPGMDGLGRPFTTDDVAAIEALDLVRSVAPTQPVPAYATTDNAEQPVLVTATTPEFFEVAGLELAAGEMFSNDGAEPVPLILGERSARELFGATSEPTGESDPDRDRPLRQADQELESPDPDAVIGQAVDLDGTLFYVAGMLKRTERGPFGFNHNASILAPLAATVAPGSEQSPDVRTMLISVTDVEQMDAARDQIRSLLRKRRGLSGNQRSDFSMRGIDQIVSMIKETTGTVTTVISLIAAISLLVGGIGIMNVMLVTVTERTREIGVRIAIGAEPRDVMLQFLVEACMLTAFGGLLGLALGLITGAIAAQFVDLPFSPNILVSCGVLLFSVLLGALFGFLPARRASRINPIDALRHE